MTTIASGVSRGLTEDAEMEDCLRVKDSLVVRYPMQSGADGVSSLHA